MIRTVITDIEGTVGALHFVKGVLFPFAHERLPDFVRAHTNQPDVATWLNDLCARHDLRRSDLNAQIEQLLALSNADVKDPALKALQGMIWADGYAAQAFVAHLYPDVLPALRAWQQQGIVLYVYSSGSLPAQLQYFRHTEHGDISALFKGFFDTHVGNKRDPAAYAEILRRIGQTARECAFLSDISEELDAAAANGIHTWRLVRDGELDLTARHREVSSLAQIDFTAA